MKFKRQVPIGIYIADFLCCELKVVVEIDGGIHSREGGKEYDENREAYLQSRGYRIVRFANKEISASLDSVLERIVEEIFR